MSDADKLQLAGRAISHVLGRISESPEIGWYMGHGTESFARLCAAHAALHGGTAEAVLEAFAPTCARDPRKDLTARIDELEQSLEERAEVRGELAECTAPTYGPRDLTAEEFRERVQLLLLTESHTPEAFLASIVEMFDSTELPIHCL